MAGDRAFISNTNPMEYLRIGTSYFKKVSRPLPSGEKVNMLMPWSSECIKQDHGRSFLSEIPRFDGFCLVPDHLKYQQVIGNFYNKYQPFLHQPMEGEPTTTLIFLNHIFGNQLNLGLDYLKILLIYPMQVLPILCLLSTERNTGKTTFLNFLKALFGDNMTINSNDDFRSTFNSEWANKLIIGVDETFLDRKEDSEKIKSLSTSKYYKIESKGQDRQEIEFFGKFILCSNNEDNFIIIDPGEIRYWVRKLPSLDRDNKNLLADLKSEIPLFLHYLLGRPFSTHSVSRMWFRADLLATPALTRVKRYNRNKLDVEMAQLLLFILDAKEGINKICFSLSDIQDWLVKKGFRNHDTTSVRSVLQNTWQLKPEANSLTYLQFKLGTDGILYEFNNTGRFYTVSEKDVLKLNNLDEPDESLISS
jgi:Family of unknown function (DUF5906)